MLKYIQIYLYNHIIHYCLLFFKGEETMFSKKHEKIDGRDALVVSVDKALNLSDTFECGQCFRHIMLKGDKKSAYTAAKGEEISASGGYTEYLTVVGEKLITVGQREVGELIFFGVTDEEFEKICVPYFALDRDFDAIREDVLSHTDSEFLKNAAEAARGVRILAQEPWEALFSFIISQNNNIPRIRKIIRTLASEYGKNLAEEGIARCPKDSSVTPSESVCRECGICYTFPRPEQILASPEKMLTSRPGFRYKYLLDAARKVASGEVSLPEISMRGEYAHTLEELKKICGVGEKVAACVALFAFSNYDAFPVDVWMRRAIDKYFGGELNPRTLGSFAGVAQQYIFHYIRNLEAKEE